METTHANALTRSKSSVDRKTNHRILVVDDNSAIHSDFRKILTTDAAEEDFELQEADVFGETATIQRMKFDIDVAFQGQEALASVQAAAKAERRYSLVFVDMRMPPGWDGLETAQKLWEADADLQIVICTAYSDYSWNEMMKEIASPDRLLILKKPFDTIEVLQLAHALTEKWSLLQAANRNAAALERLVRMRTREIRTINTQLESELAARGRAEESLRRKNTLIRMAARLTRTGGWAIELPEKSLFWSDAVFDILEFSPRATPQLSRALALYPSPWREKITTAVETCSHEGTPFDMEAQILTGKGDLRWVRLCAEAERSADGTVKRVQGAIQDITETKKAEERLTEQASLLDKAQDAIFVRDLHDKITYWNKSAERLYGWSASEAIGQSAKELLHGPAGRDAFQRAVDALLPAGEWSGELCKIAKSGLELTVEARWTLVRDLNGQPKAIFAINTDITEKKNFEAQFLRAQRVESIGTLAGGIAHDLNNMLAPIMLSIDLLKLKFLDRESDDLLSTLQTSARHGAELVKQVLSFARGVDSNRVEVDLLHLMREVQKVARDTFPKSIVFDLVAAKDLRMVMGNPTQLHQVLLNLCVNARDAMLGGGKLTVRLKNILLEETGVAVDLDSSSGAYVTVQVLDTGNGIPPEILEKIFEPFFSTKEFGKGTGLGLSTTHGIVKSHGGFIEVHSEVGKGTEFKVYLPADIADEAVEETAVAQAQLPRGRGETVLVVDDEGSIREITQMMLKLFGYQVMTASNGAQAESIYEEHQEVISVVLTDMAMPIMDGPALVIALKKLNPQVRIIAATGLASVGGLAKAVGAGVRHILPKPYTAEVLLQSLHITLGEACTIDRCAEPMRKTRF